MKEEKRKRVTKRKTDSGEIKIRKRVKENKRRVSGPNFPLSVIFCLL